MVHPVHILILAAGASSRMQGVDKLLLPVMGEPLLVRSVQVAAATGMPVTVVVSPAFPARKAALHGIVCRFAQAPDASQGMSASIRRGLMAVSAISQPADIGLMILPADMPLFTTAALSGMIKAFAKTPDRILRGVTQTGEAGHPAIFPRAFWPALASIAGDQGGRSVLVSHAGDVDAHALPGHMAVLDLDTPEDWARFRASTGA